MGVKFFEAINSVLSQSLRDICRVYRLSEDEAVEKIREYLVKNSREYWSDSPSLRYDDPLCRMAYLYAYVSAHANLVDNAFYLFPELKRFVLDKMRKEGMIRVCSFGGGPGSELLGFVKFIEREAKPGDRLDIYFVLIDKVREWDESWHALVNGLEQDYEAAYGSSRRDWPVLVHRSFLPLDLTSVEEFKSFPSRFRDVDVYVLNYTVSELVAHREEFFKVFALVVERAESPAYFLFIDRNQPEVVEAIQDCIKCAGLVECGHTTQNTNMDLDEQKTDLGKWYILMGRNPKLTWNAYFVLAEVVEPIPF